MAKTLGPVPVISKHFTNHEAPKNPETWIGTRIALPDEQSKAQ